jgi:uncharacterized membrane protein YhaH (DUF805 family)
MLQAPQCDVLACFWRFAVVSMRTADGVPGVGMLTILKQVALLLFLPSGRVRRRAFWGGSFLVTALFLLLSAPIEALLGRWGMLAAFLPFYWSAFCLMRKRCHDIGRSSWWLLLLLLPIIGVLWVIAVLAFRRGNPGSNQYGPDPRTPPPDYLTVEAVA